MYEYCVEREPLDHTHGIHVASWRWDEVRPYYAITMFIMIAGLAKLAFHHAHFLSSRVPESCLLILLGITMGLLTYHFRHLVHEEHFPDIELPSGAKIGACQTERSAFLPNFNSNLFFLVLLPPIILEAAYSLHDRTFADNLGTILLYAVVGTLFNMFTIGPLLYGLAKLGAMGSSMFPAYANYDIANISLVQMLTFSSLIVAVDPVAVLAIFQEVGVNKDLYFLVFGESLLNDAVTVVLYNAMVAFAGQDGEVITYDQLLLAVAAFFCVSLGGLTIGIIFGVLTAIITKHTSELPVVEPLSLLALSYLAYLSAELVHFSGIIATVGCGVVQAHYATKNISKNSYITIKYFVSMASSTSDTIIFMFLGMVLISDDHRWHTGFCLWTLVLCLVFRFIGVYLLTALANRNRMNRIGRKEQFIMAYGGLRGAVGFSLVVMLGDDVIDKETAQVFVTCTLFIVLFTVFVQGSTIKVLVNIFRIKLDENEEKTLAEEIVTSSLDHIAEGIEEIVGFGGLNRLKERLETFDENYLTPWLVHTAPMSALARLYDKLVLDEHYANLYGPAAVLETQKDYDTNSVVSSLPAYPSLGHRDRAGSILPEDLPLEIEPGWMRRKSMLSSHNVNIARRLSSAANLPLPEDELVSHGSRTGCVGSRPPRRSCRWRARR
ncbi:Na(+)/H(+) exchanger beta-like [Pollicipes pollicipes]|uniref:Na(+)/H(+) exchanger beta-like n=1 Tax=Pollicipes pollicipes TaxID=41117 RepID=UPI001884B8DD|nr:Na(+)/H(+) exchanger beta-like [Pollicipes pollicipes]